MEGETPEDKDGMETPADKTECGMGGETEARGDWMPILALGQTTKCLDFLALTSASLSCSLWHEACEEERQERRECESSHMKKVFLWSVKIEPAHQVIRYPQTANTYGRNIRTGVWFSDLCGVKFGPRPLGIAKSSLMRNSIVKKTMAGSRCQERLQ